MKQFNFALGDYYRFSFLYTYNQKKVISRHKIALLIREEGILISHM